MKVVILAGGKGTRLTNITDQLLPKPMVKIDGLPILEHQIKLAVEYGHKEIILLVGYLADMVKDYFGDGGEWGAKISYHEEAEPLGTSGAIREVADNLKEDFFVFYGDTMMDIELNMMEAYHRQKSADITLYCHPNDHPFDSYLVKLNDTNKVEDFYLAPHGEDGVHRNMVSAAMYILSPKIINFIPAGKKSDFVKDIFPKCLNAGMRLYAYCFAEYIKDMGTPERLQQVSVDYLKNNIHARNRKNKQRAIFLDRDGVICRDVDLLHKPDQLELIGGAAEAIRMINKSGYLAILVTNQPVIARNLCTIEELNNIHNKLETLLGKEGAYLNSIYYCPHHPDGGYPEERKEYKMKCDCRKPKPGMILSAAQDWNITLEDSYLIGDRETDKIAGIAARVKGSYIIEKNKNNALLKLLKRMMPDDNLTNTI